jgi:hypothetical protein
MARYGGRLEQEEKGCEGEEQGGQGRGQEEKGTNRRKRTRRAGMAISQLS